MRAEIYPVPNVPCGRLAIMPRPRAGDWLAGEIDSWRRTGLNVIVSLLEESEIVELGLEQEQALCERASFRFLSFPISDRGVPASSEEFSALIQSLVEQLRKGRGVGIHCRMGIGRSALVAAHVLVALGVPVESAWASIEQSRGLPVPDTPEQRGWHM
jgi:protein-tyrosine phosphatase